MLAISFFAAVFSSLLWLIYSLAYISDNTIGVSFSSLGLVDVCVYVALVVLPILVVWIVFGYVVQFMNFRGINHNLYLLFRQMKKNQDYTDLIARIMLESEQQIKDGFIMNRIDILISDMNELIAELLNRAALASKEQIESLWGRVRNGGKWALGKVIIEISQNQPNFQMRIFEKSQKDILLAGTVLEFCARYQNILSLLEKHDKERVFLNVIETGIFGKVYSILAPIADEVRKYRDISSLYDEKETSFSEDVERYNTPKRKENIQQNPLSQSRTSSLSSPHIPEVSSFEKKAEQITSLLVSGISKLGIFKKKENTPTATKERIEKDPFSIALERSFGSSEEEMIKEPQISLPQEEDIAAPSNEPQINLSTTEEVNSDILIEPRFEDHIKEEEKAELNIAAVNVANDVLPQERPDEKEDIISVSHENEPEDKETENEEIAITTTQKTLNELKKEWEDMRKASLTEETKSENKEQVSNGEDFVYPFGGWTDESNYK